MTQNGGKIINYLLIIVLILMICGNCCYSSFNTVIREGLTGPTDIENDLLLGVGANYKLVTYVGTTWVAVTQPAGLIQDSLLAITMGPDGKLYAISSDFHIMVNNAGGWQKPRQPTGTQWISIATENNQLIGIGQDWKIYVYNITSGTVTPLPPLGTPGTGPVISVLNYDGTDFAVQKDHKLYKWINDKWALYDGSPGPGGDGGLINICEYNGAMWGVGTDKKLYSYSGIPGKWGVPAGNEGIQLLSIYGMSHDNYVKFGFL